MLVTDPRATYVDATFGRGGHARLILQRLASTGRLIAFDRDPAAVAAAADIRDPRFHIEHTAFSRLDATLAALGVTSVHGVLLDIGVSSPQIDDGGTRLLMALRRSARHAYGHNARRDGGAVAGAGIDR